MEPVTRIEGHAKITVHLDEAGNVEDTRLHVMEFRGYVQLRKYLVLYLESVVFVMYNTT